MFKRGRVFLFALAAAISIIGISAISSRPALADDTWTATGEVCSVSGANRQCDNSSAKAWISIFNKHLKAKGFTKCQPKDHPGNVNDAVDSLAEDTDLAIKCAGTKEQRECTIRVTNKTDLMGTSTDTVSVSCKPSKSIAESNTGSNSQAMNGAINQFVSAICAHQGDNDRGMNSTEAVNTCSSAVTPSVQKCITDHKGDSNAMAKCVFDKYKGKYDLAGLTDAQQLANLQNAAIAANQTVNTADNCTKQGKLYYNGECVNTINDTSVTEKNYTDFCSITFIGWILCPVTKFMGLLSDGMFSVLQNLMEIDSNQLFSTSGSAFKAFQTFLPIANVVLAIIFLVIIYSEATGNGFGALSNYSIKKLLPKVVIFAILINLSWWLCAVAVDISNILGANLNSFFVGASKTIDGTYSPGFADLASQALVATTATGAAIAFGATAGLLPVLGFVILALGLVLIIMIVRQALVIMLCVVAPIAIAMAILPGTNKIFVKWKNLFISMLIAYPLISALFGASQLASSVIAAGGKNDILLNIVSIGVLGVPLIMAPAILFKVLKGVPGIGNALSKTGGSLTKGMQQKAGARMSNAYQHSMGHHAMVRGRGALARGQQNIRRGISQRIQNFSAQHATGSSLGAKAARNALGAASNIALGSSAGRARTARRANEYQAMVGRQKNAARKNAAAIWSATPMDRRMKMLTTGRYESGQQMDNDTWAALIEMNAINMTHAQNYELLANLAERGRQLQRGGIIGAANFQQRQSWNTLASTGVAAMSKSKNALAGGKALNEILGIGSKSSVVLSQAEIDQKILGAVKSTNAGKLAGMSQPQIASYRTESATIMAAQAKADQYNSDQGLTGDQQVTAADILGVSSRGNADIHKQFGVKYDVTTPDITEAESQVNEQWANAATKTLGDLEYSNATNMGMSMISGNTKNELAHIAIDGGNRQVDSIIKQQEQGDNPLESMSEKEYKRVKDTYTGDYHPDPNDDSKVVHIAEIKAQRGRDQDTFDGKMESQNENYIDQTIADPSKKSGADKVIKESFERSVTNKIKSVNATNIGDDHIGDTPTPVETETRAATPEDTKHHTTTGASSNNVLELRKQYTKFGFASSETDPIQRSAKQQILANNFDQAMAPKAAAFIAKGGSSSNAAVDQYLHRIASIAHGGSSSGKAGYP